MKERTYVRAYAPARRVKLGENVPGSENPEFDTAMAVFK